MTLLTLLPTTTGLRTRRRGRLRGSRWTGHLDIAAWGSAMTRLLWTGTGHLGLGTRRTGHLSRASRAGLRRTREGWATLYRSQAEFPHLLRFPHHRTAFCLESCLTLTRKGRLGGTLASRAGRAVVRQISPSSNVLHQTGPIMFILAVPQPRSIVEAGLGDTRLFVGEEADRNVRA